uniref:SXP/RAL-2 family protein Ani s 5-like cation-binding domain-containing protein n=1 Tax=Plectus sambesii TaxID=2011161 RepID=A0A914WF92_9BILA
MASAKLVIVGLCVLAAVIQAAPQGKQGGFGGPGGKGGKDGAGKHGGHGGPFGPRPCMIPTIEMLTQKAGLDSATAQSVVDLWKDYKFNTDCSDIQAKEEAIVKPKMEEAKAAKVAALSPEAKAVYDQIKAVLDDSTITDMKEKKTKMETIMKAPTTTDAIKAELKALLPHGGHGDHSGERNGTPGPTPAASA